MSQFPLSSLPPDSPALRARVREFVAANLPAGWRRNSDFMSGYNADFSAKLGAQGWIGMTWPRQYGGGEHSYLERYVVTEELLAAGAPISAHWFADRQTGPLLLGFGSERQRERFLPSICRGECFFSIGMSEPDSGSDLASIRTSARAVDGGWLVNGSKLWTSFAHLNHHMVTLVRTAPPSDKRHEGMSQLIIDLKGDGVQVNPIRNMAGRAEFNEVVFTDAFVPHENLVGTEGEGWQQVTSELAHERSGPERFLSTFRVYVELIRLLGREPAHHQAAAVGRITAQLMTLRRLSISVAGMLESGQTPNLEAALVKELGNNFEKALLEITRQAVPEQVDRDAYEAAFNESLLLSPSITLRGGTREILRGVIARGLGLR
ncbi:MAG: acyl-CoA dehydrogenase family protein [Halioglobus sp.]